MSGSGDDKGGGSEATMGGKDKRPPPEPTPFEKFTELTKRLVNVPKRVVDEKIAEHKRRPKGRRRAPAGSR